MSDGLGMLSTATGLHRKDLELIAEQVKANHASLESCPFHDFRLVPQAKANPMRQRYVCARCGGEVDAHAFYWHEKGRRPQDAESGGRAR